MRRILVDYGRQRATAKRDGQQTSLEDTLHITDEKAYFFTVLDQLLDRLAEVNPRQARIVELRYFSGLTEEEIASVLEISVRTVKRDWAIARAWLHAALSA
jgi:RNA polymerase sigma-70 factor, ECF subfamily